MFCFGSLSQFVSKQEIALYFFCCLPSPRSGFTKGVSSSSAWNRANTSTTSTLCPGLVSRRFPRILTWIVITDVLFLGGLRNFGLPSCLSVRISSSLTDSYLCTGITAQCRLGILWIQPKALSLVNFRRQGHLALSPFFIVSECLVWRQVEMSKGLGQRWSQTGRSVTNEHLVSLTVSKKKVLTKKVFIFRHPGNTEVWSSCWGLANPVECWVRQVARGILMADWTKTKEETTKAEYFFLGNLDLWKAFCKGCLLCNSPKHCNTAANQGRCWTTGRWTPRINPWKTSSWFAQRHSLDPMGYMIRTARCIQVTSNC